mmetsp:Transcript_8132/g.15309  ORF Transcript_8132/g.15309 Transcript_8132/m.15309 type:complete len:1234 (+) Transcript_8132:111-3812(+)
MDTTHGYSPTHAKDLKPKTKLDFLAEKVLSATTLFPQLSPLCFDCQDQPFLCALETVVEVNHGGLVVKAPASPGGIHKRKVPTNGLLTCTNAPNFASEKHKPQEYNVSPTISRSDLVANANTSVPSLEDYAPFSEDFYRSFGQMIVCAYTSAAGPYKAEIKKDASNDDGQPKEHYSLYQSIDAIRVTRLLSLLMEFDIFGDETNKYSIKEQTFSNENDIERVCFLDLLLYYTEGNSNIEVLDENSVSEGPSVPQQAVPLLNSIFKHFAALPHLEGHVHTMTRLFRAGAPPITQDGTSAFLKAAHMEKTEAYQDRLEEELRNHVSALERIASMMYERGDCTLRTKARLKIGSLLHSFSLSNGINRGFGLGGLHPGVENTGAAFVEPLLKIVLRILRGIRGSENGNYVVPESYKHLLREVLLPLHKPSGMTLWRDQQPLLGLYHKVLVQCIGALVSLDKSLIAEVIKQIIHPDIWPLEGKQEGTGTASAANTPKLVLLLHEIDTYIGLLDMQSQTTDAILADEVLPLVLRLCTCISSDNSRASERALEFFKNKSFKMLVRIHLRTLMRPLLAALCRVDSGMDVPWNPTVQKMTLIVLRELESFDPKLFTDSFRDLYSSRKSQFKKEEAVLPQLTTHAAMTHTKKGIGKVPPVDIFSLKRSMGDWRPPIMTHTPHMETQSQGASFLTSSMPPPKSRMPQSNRSKVQPPLTVTGVAPWAIQSSNSLISTSLKPNIQQNEATPEMNEPKHYELESLKRKDHSSKRDMDEKSISKSSENDSIVCLQEYMDKLKSPSSTMDSESDDGFSGWAKAQMAESPVLLPGLKFHDLVFGDVLGTGAFSTVKYARQIVKGKTRSRWPEYGIKIVSTQKIAELGYERSINREIAILGLMGHPCISRLISSFRFRDGAYLVLEYAAGGDLHSLLKRNGSINEDSTRFVIGEVISALHYIHELGFVYADLKPENVLITELGHFKLTDFGACRPVTVKAKLLIKDKRKNYLKSLRDGDWHGMKKSDSMSIDGQALTDVEMEEEEEEDDDDTRIEGTIAYLPPEVVMGGTPTFYADSWALGCLCFQCLAGRPPLLDTCETSTRQRIVTFDISASEAADDDFFDKFGRSSFSDLSKNMIRRLLAKIPHERPSMSSIATDAFFQGENIFSYYKGAPRRIDPGAVGPSPDASWSRRQFSSIWAPQPKAYAISNAKGEHLSSERGFHRPILERNERDNLFLQTGSKMLSRISEMI